MRYLLITYLRKSSGQIDEQVGFSTRLRDKDLSSCNVIVDYKDKKVIKCVIEGKKVETDFGLMDDYYRKIYPELIDQLNDNASKYA
jgi:hypothetical protein